MAKLNEKTKVHSMFRGDVEEIVDSVEKVRGQILNSHVEISFEMISVNDLVPLESQRQTSGKWVVERLKDMKGYDVLAAGALSVARDPDDNVNYVFDGCGRLALAQINGMPEKLPCLVYHISKNHAAYYFAYNQSRGRRNMDPETIFVNQVYGRDKTLDSKVQLLKDLGCYIQGKTEIAIPEKIPGNPEVKYMIITKGYQKANCDVKLMRTVRDMICEAWKPTGKSDEKYQIMGDLFTGLIYFLQVYPEAAQPGGLRDTLQKFLNSVAVMCPNQTKLSWKRDGGQVEHNQDFSVAMGMAKAFVGFLSTNEKNYPLYKKIIVLRKLNERFVKDQREEDEQDDYQLPKTKTNLKQPLEKLFNIV